MTKLIQVVVVNLKQLEVFLWVAELRSFTKAASKLYMSQPAVSFQIRALEEDLGTKLFWRNGKNVTLTPAGQLLRHQARQMISDFYKIKAGLNDLKNLKTGSLFIGASTIPGEYILPLLIGAFHQKYPGIRVSLQIADSIAVGRWIASNEIDLGFCGMPISGKEIKCSSWMDDRLVFIVPPDHPWEAGKIIALDELAKQPLLLREPGSGTRRTLEAKLINKGITLDQCNVVMELGSTRAVITAVQAGLGVSAVSYLAAQEPLLLKKVKEITIKDLDLSRKLYIIRNQDLVSNYAAATFYEFALGPKMV